jgi:menaquinone-9 beta-reductase
VAEGISMAIQSGWLLGERLAARGSLAGAALREAGADYARDWHRHFATRVRASRVFAAATVAPVAAQASIALMRALPAILTWGALWSGKAHRIERMESSA